MIRKWLDRLPYERNLILFFMGFSIVVRLVAMRILPGQFFPDSLAYEAAGRELFASGRITNDFCMPLYPIFMGIVDGIGGIRYLDILFSSLSVGLLGLIVSEVWKNRIATALSLLFASVYPFFVFYSISALSENSFIFFLLTAFLFFYRDRWILAAVALILSILIRPAVDFLSPLLIFGFAFFIHRVGMKKSLVRVGVYFVIYAVLLAPWWVHNFRKYDGKFVRLNLSTGYVLYSGNNPKNESGGGIGEVDFDVTQFAHLTNPFERDQAMKAAAIDYIVSNPGQFLKLSFLKFLRYWRLWPYAPQYSDLKYVVISCLSFVPILALSLFALFRFRRDEWIKVTPILLLILYMTAVHMVTIGSIRYRLPLEPFLILFAVHPISRFLETRRV